MSDPEGADRPVLRVVRGDPTPEELAALVAALAAATGPARRRTPCPGPGTGWGDRATLLRKPVYPGPGAWRSSGLPGH